MIVRVALATLTPTLAMVLWSLLLASKARWRLGDPLALVSGLAVFAGVAVALGVAGQVWLSGAFIAVAVIKALPIRPFEPRAPAVASSQPESAVFRSQA